MDLASTVTLNNGVAMPRYGLGVFRSGSGAGTRDAVRCALELGVRHIDTAAVYGNEAEVGEAIRQSGVAREAVFVTTKLWNGEQGYESALAAFEKSRRKLGLDTLDLYLLHWPVPERRLESWRALEKLLREGACRAIGVSNFTVSHLDELMAVATVPPAVNQFEIHPFLQQRDMVARSRELGLVVAAYSPLTKARRLDDPALLALAEEVGRSPAQVLIRWSLQHGFAVLPKSSNPRRIAENAAVFDFALSEAQVQRLDALDQGFRTAWDPTTVP